jgi:hypothetical protein
VLYRFPGISIPAPGPLAPFVSGVLGPRLAAQFKAEARLATEARVGFSCGVSPIVAAGFDYQRGQEPATKPIRTSTLGDECKFDNAFTFGASENGIGTKVEVTARVTLQVLASVQFGGPALEVATKFLNAVFGTTYEPPQLRFLRGDFGPQIGGIFENETWVLANNKAGARVGVDMIGEIATDASCAPQNVGKDRPALWTMESSKRPIRRHRRIATCR